MKQFRRVRDVADMTLRAADGDVGHVSDLYFDDRSWVVRYLVAKTGGWLLGRNVLIAPVAVAEIDDADGALRLDLTKDQIERAPPLDKVQPLSRDYEEAYYRHFQWAPYWQPGPVAWGSSLPYPETPPVNLDQALPSEPRERSHLRSGKEVTGCRIHARDGEIGHLEDLVIDDEDWVVRYVEVDTRNWLPGKRVLVQTGRIARVDWTERIVDMALTRHAIESAPAYNPSELITPDYEVQLFKHYGKEAA
jgi:hypothetical protein